MKKFTRVNNLLPILFLFGSLILVFWGCGQQHSHKTVEGTLIRVDSISAPIHDVSIDSIISTYREKLAQEMNVVIGYGAHAMLRASPEGLLNNFVADLVLAYALNAYQPSDGQPIDFCLLNYGGLRSSLPAGDITIGNVFELMPFDNSIVILTLSPEKTQDLFEYLASQPNGMPISGLRLGIRDQKPVKVEINGQPFDPSRNYKVVTSDFLARGGDRMNFFLDPLGYEVLETQIRDAIMMHIKSETARGKVISSKLDGRLSITN